MTKPWIHVLPNHRDVVWEVRRCLRPNGLVGVLNGDRIRDLKSFYVEIDRAVPLISGFGRNLDALIDLIRTFGWYTYAGKRHCFIWKSPDGFMAGAPGDFATVLDILVGVSKELLVGEELNPTFDPTDVDNWIPTRLDVVICPDDEDRIREIAAMASRLSESWADEFRSLDVPVHIVSTCRGASRSGLASPSRRGRRPEEGDVEHDPEE